MSSINIGLYGKAIIGALMAGGTAAVAALTSGGTISGLEWTIIVGAVLVGLGAVWRIPNTPVSVAKYGKAVTAALVAAAGATGIALVNGIDAADLINILLSGLAAGGFVIPITNAAEGDPVVDGSIVPVTTAEKEEIVNSDEDSFEGEDFDPSDSSTDETILVFGDDDTPSQPGGAHLSVGTAETELGDAPAQR